MAQHSPNRLPALDGLRAISVTMVVLGHLIGTRGFPDVLAHTWTRAAQLGVGVFFVISGFLITTLLLEERARTGTIGLTQFYIRRAYRILPAAYAYMLVIAALAAAGAITVGRFDLVHAATYTTNFAQEGRSWWLGHLWSLSVEEQFYLLWPALVLVLSARGALKAAFVAIALAPLTRAAIVLVWRSHHGGIGEYFPAVCDGLAMGCVLAVIRPWLGRKSLYLAFLRHPAFWLIPIAIVATLGVKLRPAITLLAVPLFTYAGIALLIDRCLRFTEGAFVRVLELRPMVWVGTLSYSLYLWQQPFVNRTSDSWVAAFPQNIVLTLVAASLSYYLVEQPFLRLRARRAAARAAGVRRAVA